MAKFKAPIYVEKSNERDEMKSSRAQQYYKQWFWKAPIGLAITGFGISLIGESIMAKANATSFSDWFFLGTISLIVFNAGLCIFGDAVKARAIYEIEMRHQSDSSA